VSPTDIPKRGAIRVEVVDRSHLMGQQGPQGFVSGIRQMISLMTKKEKSRAVFLLGSMVVNAVLSILGLSSVMPFIYLMVADEPFQGASIPARVFRLLGLSDVMMALFVIGSGIVILAVVKVAYALSHMRAVDSFCAQVEVRMSTKLLRQITEAPYQWLMTKNATILREIALARSSEWARGLRIFLQLTGNTLFLFFAVITIVAISPSVGVIVTLAAVALSALLLRFSKSSLLRFAESKRIYGRRALLAATDAIMGGRDVRMSRAGRLLVNTFHADQTQFGVSEVGGRIYSALPGQVSEVIGVPVLVALGVSMLLSGMPRSEVSAIMILYGLVVVRALPVVSLVVGSISALYNSFPPVAELHSFTVEAEGLTASVDEAPLMALENWSEVALMDVSFCYPQTKLSAITALSLTIRRGERVGVVGSSGAGKSTLIDILVGLLRPSSGGVYVSGSLLTLELERAWQQQMGYVAQSPFLVDGTLLDNVTLGADDREDREKRCIEALHAAGLGPMLQSLPQGIYSRGGDLGGKLSGGQRQRVAIARALYRKATILVFDEATSALDSITERDVVDGIFALGRDVTVVIIAHRLSLVQRCDKIAVLDKGRLIVQGSHQELMVSSSIYRDLAHAQNIKS